MTERALIPLPTSWCYAGLADLCESITDGDHLPPPQVPVGVPFVVIGDVSSGALDLSNTRFVSESYYANLSPTRQPKCGDVLYTVTGSFGIPIEVETTQPFCVQRHIAILRPRDEVGSRYLAYALRTAQAFAQASAVATGTAQKTVGLKHLRALQLPLAPDRQRGRIVDELDSYLSRLDSALASLGRTQRNLKRYRASVLQAAVEGRLVPTEAELAKKEGRSYEPASKLLERILVERRRQWIEREAEKLFTRKLEAILERAAKKGIRVTPDEEHIRAEARAQAAEKYIEPEPPDTSGLPPLPRGWCWTSLEVLLREPLMNGHSAKRKDGKGGIPTLTLTAVTEHDFGARNIKMTDVSPDAVADLWLEPGDILIERANTPELVGTAALYSGERDFAIYPDLLIRVRLLPDIPPRFLELVLMSPPLRRYFQRAAQGIAGSMPKINQDTVLRASIPLPPASEVGRIATEIDRLTSVQANVTLSIQQQRGRVVRLRQATLAWAFSGKLVDQDPNDEPASVLLQRIMAERAATVPAPAKKKAPRRQKQKASVA